MTDQKLEDRFDACLLYLERAKENFKNHRHHEAKIELSLVSRHIRHLSDEAIWREAKELYCH